jgi:hypothetical protein
VVKTPSNLLLRVNCSFDICCNSFVSFPLSSFLLPFIYLFILPAFLFAFASMIFCICSQYYLKLLCKLFSRRCN